MIVEAAIDYVVEKLIVKAVEYVFSLLNPAGAVAQAIMLIYRVLSWIFRNAARIFAFVQAVVGGMADVIAGNVGGLANTVERALGIDAHRGHRPLRGAAWAWRSARRSGRGHSAMQAYILGIIDRIVGFLVTQARALLRRLGVGGEEHPDDEHATTTTTNSATRCGSAAAMRATGCGLTARAATRDCHGRLHAQDRWAAKIARVARQVGLHGRRMTRGARSWRRFDAASTTLNNDATALAAAFRTRRSQIPTMTRSRPDDSAVEAEERSLASLSATGVRRLWPGRRAEQSCAGSSRRPARTTSPALVARRGRDSRSAYLSRQRTCRWAISTTARCGPDDCAAEAAAAAAQRVATREHSATARAVVPRAAPSARPTRPTPAFCDCGGIDGGNAAWATRVRKAYGRRVRGRDSRPRRVANLDPIDTAIAAAAFARMRWRAAGAALAIGRAPPATLHRNGLPPSIELPAAQLARVPARHGARRRQRRRVYGLPRLRWAWSITAKAERYLEGQRSEGSTRQPARVDPHEHVPRRGRPCRRSRPAFAPARRPTSACSGSTCITNLRTDTDTRLLQDPHCRGRKMRTPESPLYRASAWDSTQAVRVSQMTADGFAGRGLSARGTSTTTCAVPSRACAARRPS